MGSLLNTCDSTGQVLKFIIMRSTLGALRGLFLSMVFSDILPQLFYHLVSPYAWLIKIISHSIIELVIFRPVMLVSEYPPPDDLTSVGSHELRLAEDCEDDHDVAERDDDTGQEEERDSDWCEINLQTENTR